MSFRAHWRGSDMLMWNVFRAPICCGRKTGFRRRTSNGDTAWMLMSFPKAAPATCSDAFEILVTL